MINKMKPQRKQDLLMKLEDFLNLLVIGDSINCPIAGWNVNIKKIDGIGDCVINTRGKK